MSSMAKTSHLPSRNRVRSNPSRRRLDLNGPSSGLNHGWGMDQTSVAAVSRPRPRRKRNNYTRQSRYSEDCQERDIQNLPEEVPPPPTPPPPSETLKKKPQYQYNREQLFSFKNCPAAKKRPASFDVSFVNSRGVCNLDILLQSERKRSETPPEENTNESHKICVDLLGCQPRRAGDPRERLRKEQDGIVLSPQRRSFNSGCFVTQSRQSSVNTNRSESPTSIKETTTGPTRRIGSGRILSRDSWGDFHRDKEDVPDRYDRRSSNVFSSSQQTSDNSSGSNNRRIERRSNGLANSNSGSYDRSGTLVNRQGRRSSSGYNSNQSINSNIINDEEPEWFSGGPTSQNETIELRGFDENSDMLGGISSSNAGGKGKKAKANNRANKKQSKDISSSSSTLPQSTSRSSSSTGLTSSIITSSIDSSSKENINMGGPGGRSTPLPISTSNSIQRPEQSPIGQTSQTTNNDQLKLSESEEPTGASTSPAVHEASSQPPNDFYFDAFMKMDHLPGFNTTNNSESAATGSRLFKFFKNSNISPQQHAQSGSQQPDSSSSSRSLLEERFNNIMNDLNDNQPALMISSNTDPDAYFAPISPALTASKGPPPGLPPTPAIAKPSMLLEMLQRGPVTNNVNPVQMMMDSNKQPTLRDLELSGKIHTVVDLEARMRQQQPTPPISQNVKMHPQSGNVNIHKKSDEEVAAFRKLLAQVSDTKPSNNNLSHNGAFAPNITHQTQQQSASHNHLPSNPAAAVAAAASLNLMQMLAKGRNPQGVNQQGQPIQHPPNSNLYQQSQLSIPQDLVVRLMQTQQQHQQQQQQQRHQQEMLSKMLSQANSNSRENLRHGPFGGAVQMNNPLPPDVQTLVMNAQPNGELLQRPEAKAIMQGIEQGKITAQHLIQQLANPGLQLRHKEVLVSILHTLLPSYNSNGSSASSVPIGQNPGHSNLSVQQQAVLQRIPSPRDLIAHTQNILQNALIKKQLEDQRENFRRRLEKQQQGNEASLGNENTSGLKQSATMSSSPTPLTFTPTSVLRKMTAENKPSDVTDGNKNNGAGPSHSAATSSQSSQQIINSPDSLLKTVSSIQNIQQPRGQPRVIMSSSISSSRPQQPPTPGGTPVTGSGSWNLAGAPKPPHMQGRPILKGNSNYQFTASNMEFVQSPPPVSSLINRPTALVYPTRAPPNSAVQQGPVGGSSPQSAPSGIKTSPIMHPTLHSTFRSSQPQQQQRSLSNINNGALSQDIRNQLSIGLRTVVPPSPSSPLSAFEATTNTGIGVPSNNLDSGGAGTSPTSNQLSKWFSPQLLAQARAGQLPILSTTKFVPVEELERVQQSSAIVHN